MNSGHLSSFSETFGAEENSTTNTTSKKLCASNQMNNILQSDHRFTVDMERFSQLTTKNDMIPNSRSTGLSSVFHSNSSDFAHSQSKLQRNLSRKGSQRGSEKKMKNSSTTAYEGDRDTSRVFVPNSSSPRGATTPEKPIIVTVGAATNHPNNQQIHHHITITPPTTTESKLEGRRFSFKRSSSSWTPRRILLFFATLSSMGTLLLIYFAVLSMGKFRGDDVII